MKLESFGLLLYGIIGIAYISFIINYLNTLKSCSCYQKENQLNYSNITYLIIIESFALAIFILLTISIIYMIIILNKGQKGGNKNKSYKTGFYIGYLISLIIYGYFIYYVYKLSENVNEECECTKSWMRYLLYIQAIFILIGLISSGVLICIGKHPLLQ
jgi:hypothetical protein